MLIIVDTQVGFPNHAVLTDAPKPMTYTHALLCSLPKRFNTLVIGPCSRVATDHTAQPIADPTDLQHGREAESAQPEGGRSAPVPAARCLAAVGTACPRAVASIPEPSPSPSSLRPPPASSPPSPSAPVRTAGTKRRPEPCISKTVNLENAMVESHKPHSPSPDGP